MILEYSRYWPTIRFPARRRDTFARDCIGIVSRRLATGHGGNASQLGNGCQLCRQKMPSSVSFSARWTGWTDIQKRVAREIIARRSTIFGQV